MSRNAWLMWAAALVMLAIFVTTGQGQGVVPCETGCNSFWMAWDTSQGTIVAAKPYKCWSSSGHWADVDEGSPCLAAKQKPYEAKLYTDCDGCDPVCNNCPTGGTCMYNCGDPEQNSPPCIFVGSVPRNECWDIQT